MNGSYTSDMSEKEIDQVWHAILERVDGRQYRGRLHRRAGWLGVSQALAAVLFVGLGLFGWMRLGPQDSIHQAVHRDSLASANPQAPPHSQSQTARRSSPIARVNAAGENQQAQIRAIEGPTHTPAQDADERYESESQVTNVSAGEMAHTAYEDRFVNDAGEKTVGFHFSELTSAERTTDQAGVRGWFVMTSWRPGEPSTTRMAVSRGESVTQDSCPHEVLGVSLLWRADMPINPELVEKVKYLQAQRRYKVEDEFLAKGEPRVSAQSVGIRF